MTCWASTLSTHNCTRTLCGSFEPNNTQDTHTLMNREANQHNRPFEGVFPLRRDKRNARPPLCFRGHRMRTTRKTIPKVVLTEHGPKLQHANHTNTTLKHIIIRIDTKMNETNVEQNTLTKWTNSNTSNFVPQKPRFWT